MDCICLSRVAVVALLQAIVGFLLSVHCRASQFITSASFSIGKRQDFVCFTLFKQVLNLDLQYRE